MHFGPGEHPVLANERAGADAISFLVVRLYNKELYFKIKTKIFSQCKLKRLSTFKKNSFSIDTLYY